MLMLLLNMMLLLLILMLMPLLMVSLLPVRDGVRVRVRVPRASWLLLFSLRPCCSRRGLPLPLPLPLPQIGAFANGDFPFDGRIGAVAVFDSALTNAQVKQAIGGRSVRRSHCQGVRVRLRFCLFVARLPRNTTSVLKANFGVEDAPRSCAGVNRRRGETCHTVRVSPDCSGSCLISVEYAARPHRCRRL